MTIKNKLSFKSDNYNGNHRIIYITGTCRAGKTSLAQILASGKNCALNDEENILQKINLLYHQNKDMRHELLGFFESHIDDIYHDIILCRKANFRKQDASNIYNNTLETEINKRMKLNRVKDAAIYNNKTNFKLIQTLAESPNINRLIAKMNCKPYGLINIIRGFEHIADDVYEKKWFTNINLKSSNLFIGYKPYTYKNIIYNLPWWVKEGDEKYFLNLNLYSRGLYYWYAINKDLFLTNKSCPSFKFMNVLYSDLIINNKALNNIIKFFQIPKTSLTNTNIKELLSRKHYKKIIRYRSDEKILNKCKQLYTKLKLEKYEF